MARILQSKKGFETSSVIESQGGSNHYESKIQGMHNQSMNSAGDLTISKVASLKKLMSNEAQRRKDNNKI